MLHFFRKMRNALLTENKFTRYFLYAFGEIVLVVIGIVIALQINNWNQDRISQKEGKQIRQNIHQEFHENQRLLKASRQLNADAINACKNLAALVGANKSELAAYNLDSLFNFSLFAESYLPSRNSLEDVLQSGKINLLANNDLKNTLLSWSAAMDKLKEYKDIQTNWQNNHYMPYLLSRISFKQMDIYNHKIWSGQSKIATNYYPVFQDIKFENLVDNNLWLLEYLMDQLNTIELLQNKIIDLTGLN